MAPAVGVFETRYVGACATPVEIFDEPRMRETFRRLVLELSTHRTCRHTFGRFLSGRYTPSSSSRTRLGNLVRHQRTAVRRRPSRHNRRTWPGIDTATSVRQATARTEHRNCTGGRRTGRESQPDRRSTATRRRCHMTRRQRRRTAPPRSTERRRQSVLAMPTPLTTTTTTTTETKTACVDEAAATSSGRPRS